MFCSKDHCGRCGAVRELNKVHFVRDSVWRWMVANRTDKTREIKKAIEAFCKETGITVVEFVSYLQGELLCWEELSSSESTPQSLKIPYAKDCLYAYNIISLFAPPSVN